MMKKPKIDENHDFLLTNRKRTGIMKVLKRDDGNTVRFAAQRELSVGARQCGGVPSHP